MLPEFVSQENVESTILVIDKALLYHSIIRLFRAVYGGLNYGDRWGVKAMGPLYLLNMIHDLIAPPFFSVLLFVKLS
jgi:hypothetical protein